MDMVRSMINISSLPLSKWTYVMKIATYVLNQIRNKAIENTSYEF